MQKRTCRRRTIGHSGGGGGLMQLVKHIHAGGKLNKRILNKDMKPLHKSMDKSMKKLHKSMKNRSRSHRGMS